MIPINETSLRGSYTPLVTPFTQQRVDYEAYARLVDLQVRGGSDGVVVTGTSGEPSMLTVEERASLVETAVVAAANRIPVVAATGCQSLPETLKLSAAAERAGASALLVVTPYYAKPPQRGLVQYFREVTASTALPVLIYHIPGRSGVEMAVESVAAVAEAADNLVGLKHASTDLGYVSRLFRATDSRFRVFVGLEELSLPLLAMGAAGVMNAVGNVAPGAVAALCAAVRANDLDDARRRSDELAELNEAVFWDINPIPIKYLMRQLGMLDANEHRVPMMPASPELERRLDALVDRTSHLLEPHGTAAATTS